jgi:hypothetical protein
VDLAVPAQDFFKSELRFAVGIDGTLRQGFVDRHALRRAEDGAGRGEDELFNAGGHHGVEEI